MAIHQGGTLSLGNLHPLGRRSPENDYLAGRRVPKTLWQPQGIFTTWLQMDSPEAVLNEVLVIPRIISPGFDVAPVIPVFMATVDLYEGRYPGYGACNTQYHDPDHITDTFLAMARLIHGAVIKGESFSESEITLGLMAALLHDAGYIQETRDRDGTGSKFTKIHVITTKPPSMWGCASCQGILSA